MSSESDFFCPCCQYLTSSLADYLVHQCTTSCVVENCKRMDIFVGPPAKRRRTLPRKDENCECTGSSECGKGSHCLFYTRKNQSEPGEDLFPYSPIQISTQSTIDLSSDDEEPLDLSTNNPAVITYEQPACNMLSQTCELQEPSQHMETEHEPEPEPELEQEQNSSNEPPKAVTVKKTTKKGSYRCDKCNKNYVFLTCLQKHSFICGVKMCTANPANVPENFEGFKLMAKAFAKYYLVYRYENSMKLDLTSFFCVIHQPSFNLLSIVVKDFKAIKFFFNLQTVFTEKITGRTAKIYFQTSIFNGLTFDINDQFLTEAMLELENRIDQFTQRGSGWTLSHLNHIDLAIGKYIPFSGGCSTHKLPDKLKNKKCMISPDTNTDCFMYSVLIGLHKVSDHRYRISNYTRYINDYDFSMVRGIVPVSNIKKFERANRISVNLYTYEFNTEKVVPLKIVDIENEKHVNIFLHDEHYYFISDMSRLVNSKKSRSRFVCPRCLRAFRLEEQLKIHKIDCGAKAPQAIDMPFASKAICKRSNYRKEVQYPFCIYADFETLSVKNDEEEYILTDLVPCSYGYVIVDWEGKIIKSDFYLGTNVGVKFLKSLKNCESFLDEYLENKRIRNHNLSYEEEQDFQNSIYCHICEKVLGDDRVRDHDHLTGFYRGAAHQQCNLEYRVPEQYPVVFHNLKNFDGHIVIKALDIDFCDKPKIIPHNMEKFIGFILGKFKFVDSFAFLPSSLDNLSTNISNESKNQYLKQIFPNIDTSLLLKKSALPYEYLTSLEVFKETLPPQSAFHSTLTNSDISNDMYQHLKDVWVKYNCKSLKDLHDIYLKVDVLLLAAVFENFREMSISNFALDPLHQFSSPGLTWNAALKKTRIELNLLTDLNMFLMIERGIRGGPTIVTKRHVKANNQYLPNFDSSKPSSFLLYLDVNNLYGYAMSEKLPVSGFKWSNTPIDQILNTADDSDTGYILEVDLEYPKELHDLHNDFPLAPEKTVIVENMYSPYQLELSHQLKQKGIKIAKSEKLTTNFNNKTRYVIHYRNLKFYLAKGMKLTKLHRVVEFYQSAWLAEYVQFCTSKRQAATSDFEKDFYKLLVNSIYGKTIEDVRKHRTVEIALQDVQAQRHLRKEQCQKFMILDENKMLFWMRKLSVLMNKPISIGFTVLELAKLKMFEIHYNTFKQHYQNNISMVYTDTDSLIYAIKTEDIVSDLRFFSTIMDFSNYPKEHPLYSNANNKKIGYLKDELAGKQIAEFVGIRPKLYALKTEDEVKKRAKGVPRNILKNKINFEDYLTCLYDHRITRDNAITLQSDHHNIQMIQRTKVMLSPLDDKRYWIDKLTSYAYGHYKIDH